MASSPTSSHASFPSGTPTQSTQPTQPALPLTTLTTQPTLLRYLANSNDSDKDLLGLCGVLVEVGHDSPVVLSIFRGQTIKIGRHHKCDVVLQEDTISNVHYLLTATSSGNVFCHPMSCMAQRDQDKSTNGTFWRNTLIGKNESVLLSHGDSIRLRPEFNFIFYDLRRKKDKHVDPEIAMLEKTYTIMPRNLGSGSFATVKLAIHCKTRTQLAVKIMDLGKFSEPKQSGETDYRQEVALLRKLKHANIISMVDVYFTNLYVYMFMQMVPGGDLFDHILTNGRLPEKESKFIGYQILLAMEYLHDNNIVHRDIKPENVLLTSPAQFPRVILTDFGMARELKNSEPLMAMCGTYAYMAPEVFDVKHAGGTGYRTSADCWSFGVLLYVIMSAMHPFARGKHKDDELVVMQRVKAKKPGFHANVWSDKSLSCFEVISHLLVREPSGRWTARDVLASPWIQHDLRWLRGEYKEIVIENWQRQLRILENIRQSPRHNGPEQIVPLSASPTPSSSSVKLASNEESCLSEDTISTSGTSYSSTLASAESVYDPTIASTTDSTICAPKRSFDANHSSDRPHKRHRGCSQEALFTTIHPSSRSSGPWAVPETSNH